MDSHNQQGFTIAVGVRTNLLEYPRMLRCVFVGLIYAIPRKAFNGLPDRVPFQSYRPYKVTELGELLSVVTVELKLWGRVDDNPSVEFPVAEYYRCTNTWVSRHDRLC